MTEPLPSQTPINEQKSALRLQVRAALKALLSAMEPAQAAGANPGDRISDQFTGGRIAARLLGGRITDPLTNEQSWLSPLLTPGNRVLAFVPLWDEVDITEVVRLLAARGVSICLPRSVAGGNLECIEAPPPWDDLVADTEGVPAPRMGRMIRPSDIDAVLVPGVAFDRRGGRLGRGKGYFDRFLGQLRPDALRLGVCYSMQVISRVPRDEGDQLVVAIATESELIRCNNA